MEQVDITKLDTSVQPVQLLPQTRRHALLAHLLRVPGIVFAVNKLDAVADPGPAFAAVRRAQDKAASAGARERALIAVLAERYAADAKGERHTLDQAYAAAMERLTVRSASGNQVSLPAYCSCLESANQLRAEPSSSTARSSPVAGSTS